MSDLCRELGQAPASPFPRSVEPMKATLTDRRFSDPAWIFERKLDGIRCIAYRSGGHVRLDSRNALSLNERFPEVVEALEQEGDDDLVLDGEVVAFAGSQTSFSRLARRGMERTPVYLYAFDILHLRGRDTTRLPLRVRKRLLRRALAWRGALRYTQHRNADGERYFAEACAKGWEGLIAKRADSTYSGRRSEAWLKFKCTRRQELVIGGFTAPRGSRTDLGALLVGYYEHDGLRYAGKVGTGFDRASLADLGMRLAPLVCDQPAFVDAPRGRDMTWVEPRLVAEVAFTEWTRDGRLRHPSFLGLRDDKRAADVVREEPA